MKAFEIIEQHENYLVLRSKDKNINKYSDAVIALGGTAFDTGSIAADPQTEHLHEVTCEVLADFGLDTTEDVIVIIAPAWAKQIEREISNKINY